MNRNVIPYFISSKKSGRNFVFSPEAEIRRMSQIQKTPESGEGNRDLTDTLQSYEK